MALTDRSASSAKRTGLPDEPTVGYPSSVVSKEQQMPSATSFGLFLTAATVLALSPGPGMLYVLARSLRGGRREGLASSLGTAVGGCGHVIAAAFGLSVLLATSATAFSVVKYAGAAYLVYLGLRTLLAGQEAPEEAPGASGATRTAFRQGVTTEAFNPKTALFFLSFLPQFINREAAAIPQFLLLGTVSVVLNTSADVVVSLLAGPIGTQLRQRPRVRHGQRFASGGALIGLGLYVAVSGERH